MTNLQLFKQEAERLGFSFFFDAQRKMWCIMKEGSETTYLSQRIIITTTNIDQLVKTFLH